MDNALVRIMGIRITNLKNVSSGEISFTNDQENSNANMLGLFGQNGSGKTVLIDALEILKYVLSGKSVPNRYVDYISVDAEYAHLTFEFLIQFENKKIEAFYEFSLGKEQDPSDGSYRIRIFDEILKYLILSGKNTKIEELINTCNSSTFVPIEKKQLLTGNAKDVDVDVDLMVARKLTNIESRSFIFSDQLFEIIEKNSKNAKDKVQYEYYKKVIYLLADFGKYSLFVINSVTSGFITINAQTRSFRGNGVENGAVGTIMIPVEENVILPKEDFMYVSKTVENMNIVLQQLIPGLTISIKELGTQLMKNGTIGYEIQLMSCKNSKEIPLKYESEGIKKIISVLPMLIAVYDQAAITVTIDDLDANIFEYLLGELLRLISERGKGQLIFTSHNLRVLETVDKQFLAFTTTNSDHRYIRLKNTKRSNNVRDMYYQEIMLGDESEELYEKTKNIEISLAFRVAGRYKDVSM